MPGTSHICGPLLQRGLSVSNDRELRKTAEAIDIPFGMWSLAGPRNRVLVGGPDPHTGRDTFEGGKEPARDMPGS